MGSFTHSYWQTFLLLRTVVVWELYTFLIIFYILFLFLFLFFYYYLLLLCLFFYICTLLLISLVYSSIYGVCLVGTPRLFASPLSNTSLFLFFCSMLVMYCLIKASNK